MYIDYCTWYNCALAQLAYPQYKYKEFSLSLFALLSLNLQPLLPLVQATPTQVMRRPDNYQHETKHVENHRVINGRAEEEELEKRAGGKVQIGYFTNCMSPRLCAWWCAESRCNM